MIAKATGDKIKQIQLSWYEASTKTSAATLVRTLASQTVTLPRGNSHSLLRGLSSSNSLSAKRLNPIAAVRAPTMATRIQIKFRRVTGYFGHAKATEDRANGNANTVCENRTSLP